MAGAEIPTLRFMPLCLLRDDELPGSWPTIAPVIIVTVPHVLRSISGTRDRQQPFERTVSAAGDDDNVDMIRASPRRPPEFRPYQTVRRSRQDLSRIHVGIMMELIKYCPVDDEIAFQRSAPIVDHDQRECCPTFAEVAGNRHRSGEGRRGCHLADAAALQRQGVMFSTINCSSRKECG